MKIERALGFIEVTLGPRRPDCRLARRWVEQVRERQTRAQARPERAIEVY
jgi:hypothetical protein